jgi:hypothetical protein
MFEADSKFKAPTVTTHRKYPFRTMQIGESFFVPGGKQANVGGCAYAHCSTSAGRGKRFTTRTVEGGVRCWRIA